MHPPISVYQNTLQSVLLRFLFPSFQFYFMYLFIYFLLLLFFFMVKFNDIQVQNSRRVVSWGGEGRVRSASHLRRSFLTARKLW